jgi:hypothetical protein
MARKRVRSLWGQSVRNLTADFAALLNEFAKRAFDPYRPELHYMRGPGPKWHAKHGIAPTEFNAVPALARIRVKR